MKGISGAFSSLSIGDSRPPRNVSPHQQNLNRSLPNLSSGSLSPSFIKNTLLVEDDISTDQPIDFSQKYAEGGGSRTYNKVVKSYNNSFSIYAETDLDQPTDYSLRYAEDDSDSDQSIPIKPPRVVEFVQDTVKTYCTEDTPYETPFNFSNATSMSDLRMDDGKPLKAKVEVGASPKPPLPDAGIISPEKPVTYCDEGTPGYFSRSGSLLSLNSILSVEPPKAAKEKPEEKENNQKIKAVKFEETVNYAEETPLMFSRSSSLASLDSIEQHSIHDDRSSVVSDFSRLTSGLVSPSELPDSPTQTMPSSPKPRKLQVQPVVKQPPEIKTSGIFDDSVAKFKTESTPIQFSTATSLSSLTIDDDVEKVPNGEEAGAKNLEAPLFEESEEEDEDILAACISVGMQNNRYSQPRSTSSPIKELPSSSYEHSPLFSADQSGGGKSAHLNVSGASQSVRSSFCSSTSDDENALLNECILAGIESQKSPPPDNKQFDESSSKALNDIVEGVEKIQLSTPTNQPKDRSEVSQIQESATAFEGSDEEDEDILAACINMGVANNRYSQQHKPVSSPVKIKTEDDAKSSIVVQKAATSSAVGDSIKTYCTEDTPFLSHAGSHSDLSVLSETGGKSNFSEINSVLSSDEDNEEDSKLLEECIQAGIKVSSSQSRDSVKTEPLNDLQQFSSSRSISSRQAPVEEEVDLNISLESNISETDLTEEDQALLNQCILEGVQKCGEASSKKPPPVRVEPPVPSGSELTKAEQVLLRQCILLGMPKNNNLLARGSATRETSGDLTETERNMLEQCIQAGMPRTRTTITRSGHTTTRTFSTSTTTSSRMFTTANREPQFRQRNIERQQPEQQQQQHTCCIHCPRNNPRASRQQPPQQQGPANPKMRRQRSNKVPQPERSQGRDVSIFYVTSQILALKKQLVDKSHEEWI